ncbi:MAG: 3-dehydroquinate synthase [Actinobacteria bacterium]|nr:3-dehydroquinate synthase [Actinomycetota bacterium]
MPLETLLVHSRLGDYTVAFQRDQDFVARLSEPGDRIFVVDQNVWEMHRTGILQALPHADVLVLPIAEHLKTLASVEVVWDALLQRSARRNMTLVSIGGGICQDITGFAASTIYRGIGWVFVPTTLLSQADSCIGSKTSLNYGGMKNLIGTFYPPSEVHIFPAFLETQQPADFFSGLGEVVKLHIMGGRDDAAALASAMPALSDREAGPLQAATRAALRIKQGYIEGDELDRGRRNLLNYGHCFGHAIESATQFVVPHGQAVVMGMQLAQAVARARRLETDVDQMDTVDRLLAQSLLAECIPTTIDEDAVVEAMKHDKKRTGTGLALVMATDGFEMVKVDDLADDEARDALATMFARTR